MGPINSNEEIFGPVLSILRWRDEGEAVAMANATEYGLSAALWTNDLKAAIKMGRKIDCGYVWINTAGSHFLGMPFGGSKNSGVGREECLSELLSYTQSKAFSHLAEVAEQGRAVQASS